MQRTILCLLALVAAVPVVWGQVCNTGCGDNCNKPVYGIDCRNNPPCGEQRWEQWGPIPWQAFGPGDFVGPIRTAPLDDYRLRPEDQIEFIYRLTRIATLKAYTFQVGDTLKIESIVDTNLNREVQVQPDGTITALHLGRVKVNRRTADEVEKDLEDRYLKEGGYRIIDLTVTPQKTNTRLEDLRAAVDSRFFTGGQGKLVKVSPDGKVRLPAIGPVCVLGLTLEELKTEVDARYASVVDGMEVSPILQTRANRFVYVLGEVKTAGRFTLEAPTTAMQAIALAGGANAGGNLREVVVFRRAEDWRLLATKLDVRGATLGKRPSPADEIWLRDSDLVVVPKTSIQRTNEFIDQVFTKGIYGVVPAQIIGSAIQPAN